MTTPEAQTAIEATLARVARELAEVAKALEKIETVLQFIASVTTAKCARTRSSPRSCAAQRGG